MKRKSDKVTSQASKIVKLKENATKETNDNPTNLRYGPMPQFPGQKRFTRHIIVISMIVVVYFYSGKDKERSFASIGSSLSQRQMSRPCSKSFIEEISRYEDCVPRMCGRGVYDTAVTVKEVAILRKLADRGFELSSPSGGAAILDLHSGALTRGQDFVNIYTVNSENFLGPEDVSTYKTARTKIKHLIAAQFMINPSSLHLTHPSFFSRLTSSPPQSVHDEYWHTHVDKETYPSFHYTALLYLSTYKSEFEGGRFHFVEEDNSTYVVEPLAGRVLIFTSGSENPHRVEPVSSGFRTALTIAFTCDPALASKDPVVR